MSGGTGRGDTPQGPSWSLGLLADYHAGVLDQQTADALRAEIEADASAQDVLAALDATRAELAALPAVSAPDDVTARIEAALAQEAAARSAGSGGGAADVVDLAAARRRRRRILRWAGAVAAGVAAVLAVVFSAVLPTRSADQQASPPAGSTSAPQPLALTGSVASLTPEQFAQVVRSEEYEVLDHPEDLLACLQANGVSASKPIGAREITLDGQRALLLVLPGGEIGQFRLLAVGPECGPGNPATLSDATFGG